MNGYKGKKEYNQQAPFHFRCKSNKEMGYERRLIKLFNLKTRNGIQNEQTVENNANYLCFNVLFGE